jgi:hypothetical protein
MTLEERVQRVEDELAIRNLLNRFSQLADEGGLDEYRSLITADAVWEGGKTPGRTFDHQARRGHEDILTGVRERMAAGIQGPGTNSHHVIVNTFVQLAGDTASSRSYFIYLQNTHEVPVVRSMGTYDDEFVRTGDGWKLAHRVLTPG